MTSKSSYVGAPVVRRDAFEKATGTAMYASDLFPDDFLWVSVLRSRYPHAHIRRIDTAKARLHAGVVAVLTHEDVPVNRFGVFVKDRPVLCDDRVRYIGDPVALVAAETREAALEAVKMIEVDYEELPAVTDPISALRADSPKVHEGGNVCRQTSLRFGDVEGAFARADVVVEGTYTTGTQIHAFLETEAGISYLDEKGRVVVVAGGQSPHRDRAEIAHALNLPPERVRVITPYVGGAFGGKDDVTVQIHLALVTMKTGRPARLVLSREESMLSGTKRHPAIIKMRTAASRDGRLLANEVEIVYDTGAYAALGPAVLDVAIENCNGPYRISSAKIDAYLVYTNNMVASAFRGFGAPQVMFAMERQIDRIARRIGIDPIELRLINAIRKGDVYVFGNRMEGSVGIYDCLRIAREHPLWRERRSGEGLEYPWLRRGVGVAAGMKGYTIGALPDRGSVSVELRRDGSIAVSGSFTEIGQGVVESVAQLTAELFKVPVGKVHVLFADTERSPDTSVTSASRQIFLAGNALRKAFEEVVERVRDLIELDTGRRPTGVTFTEEGVVAGADEVIPLGELAERLESRGLGRTVIGTYEVPKVEPIAGTLEIPHLFFMFGVTIAEVIVNVLTGSVTVPRVVAVIDAGRVINPINFTGQIEGAVVQGLGYALMEEAKIVNGYLQTKDLSTYLIPSSKDAPEIEVIPVESYEEEGPFGAKGIGEVGILSVAPAVVNAVAEACGVEPTSIPLTPEKLYWLLKEVGVVDKIRGAGGRLE
ncbi:MAG: xanthine dehydrogenase family protein molybdopterin-binding subunit [Thaumarchaeota archaeon]|nr:xanthine dehydrogenase family protein molybdopterin-binding subunit [Candidatus Calditenuaceae archaeon]MDW8042154.1 xanthine dehydrogenase family protein molybdopterin-binding subunit [Nitrososphaerota archaeon]